MSHAPSASSGGCSADDCDDVVPVGAVVAVNSHHSHLHKFRGEGYRRALQQRCLSARGGICEKRAARRRPGAAWRQREGRRVQHISARQTRPPTLIIISTKGGPHGRSFFRYKEDAHVHQPVPNRLPVQAYPPRHGTHPSQSLRGRKQPSEAQMNYPGTCLLAFVSR